MPQCRQRMGWLVPWLRAFSDRIHHPANLRPTRILPPRLSQTLASHGHKREWRVPQRRGPQAPSLHLRSWLESSLISKSLLLYPASLLGKFAPHCLLTPWLTHLPFLIWHSRRYRIVFLARGGGSQRRHSCSWWLAANPCRLLSFRGSLLRAPASLSDLAAHDSYSRASYAMVCTDLVPWAELVKASNSVERSGWYSEDFFHHLRVKRCLLSLGILGRSARLRGRYHGPQKWNWVSWVDLAVAQSCCWWAQRSLSVLWWGSNVCDPNSFCVNCWN